MWHSDATYKLNWHGYPLLMQGYSDNHRALLLRNDAVQAKLPNLHPDVHMSDGAESMFNAKPMAWASTKRGMCWSHVFRNVQKKAKAYIKERKFEAHSYTI